MNRNQRGQHLRLMGFLHYVLWVVIAVTTVCLVQVPMRSMAEGFTNDRTSRVKKDRASSRVAKKQHASETQPVATTSTEGPTDQALAISPPPRTPVDPSNDEGQSLNSEPETTPAIPKRVFAAQAQATEEPLAEQPAADAVRSDDLPATEDSHEAMTDEQLRQALSSLESDEDSEDQPASESESESDTNMAAGAPEEDNVLSESRDTSETQETETLAAQVAPVPSEVPTHDEQQVNESESASSNLWHTLLADKHVPLQDLLSSRTSPWPLDRPNDGVTISSEVQTQTQTVAITEPPIETGNLLESSLSTPDALEPGVSTPPTAEVSHQQEAVAEAAPERTTLNGGSRLPETTTAQDVNPQSPTRPQPAAESAANQESLEPAVPPNTLVPVPSSTEIAIENPVGYRTPLQFVLNNQIVALAPGQVHTVTPSKDQPVVIRYHRGGSQELQDQQTLSAGRYQFVVRRIGWDLKRLSVKTGS